MTNRIALALLASCFVTATGYSADVEIKKQEGKAVVTIDGELFTEYVFAGHSKPILYPIIGLHGIAMTRHYPMKENVDNEASDHPHHKSLWFTHDDVNGVQFWMEYARPNSERQPGKIVQTKLEIDGNKILTSDNWTAPDGKVVCTDSRVIAFGKTKAGRFIDFHITLTASQGEVTFGDTKEGTMGIRTHPMLRLQTDEKRGNHTANGKSINSEGVEGKEMWGKRAAWVDYWAPIDGNTVGIAIFDHPSNPRHPTWWHARTYGLIAANPFGIHDFEKKPKGTGDMTIKSGESLTLQYRFLFHSGDVNEANIKGEYESFREIELAIAMNEAARAALSQTNFSLADIVIVVVYLLASLAIGLMVKRYAGSMENYIGAGRKVGPWLGVATMTGTELGLVTVMYSAQKGFTGGFAAFHIAVIAGVVTLFVGLTGFIVGPLRRMEVLTIPEYYERRFNRRIRVLGGVLLVLAGVLNMGLFLKAGSMFIVGVTGLASEGEALKWVMITLLTLVLAYTTLGGMISVVLTDYVQFVVLSIGLLLATVIAIGKLGWSTIFETVHAQLGPAGFDPTIEGAGFGWAYVFWMLITAGLIGSAVWPTAVARALAMESEKAVRKQYCWSSISFAVRFMVPYFWGICALVFIVATPDGADLKPLFFPAEDGAIALDNLYAMPIFIGRLLPTVVLGIVTAGMIAAFMSTHDSYFLVWSSVITQDIVAPLRSQPMTTASRVRLTRILILLMGGYVLYWSLFYRGNEDIWDYMAVTGGIYFTGAFVVLFLGIYWKGTSSFGALLGLLSGLLMLLGLEPIQIAVGLKYQNADGDWIERLTSPQIGILTVAIAATLAVFGSLIRPDPQTPEAGPEVTP